jgi:hypothetical protein
MNKSRWYVVVGLLGAIVGAGSCAWVAAAERSSMQRKIDLLRAVAEQCERGRTAPRQSISARPRRVGDFPPWYGQQPAENGGVTPLPP